MTLNAPVRQDILTSWQRCVVAGLRPDRFEVPYQPDFDDDGPLRWAATPILDQVADELEGTGVGLLLTDARGQVVDRRAADTGILTRLDRIELAPGFLYSEDLTGTNAIGTAIAQQAPSVVTGTEHFADALTSMACAATPVTDGAGEMIGVVDLTCAAEDFNPLLLPFAKRAAREIGHRLWEGTNPRRVSARSWLSLTDTERAVAHLAAQGLSSLVVADRMRLPQPTVRSHLRRVFRKLSVRSQVELARVVEQGAARARTLAAVDDTRRRIERDLHDGLQQRLVTLGLQVRAAEVSVPPSAAELKWELTRVADGLMDALRDVREISRGIHPAILSERGLEPAVKALARRSPVPVDLTVRVAGRLPDRVRARGVLRRLGGAGERRQARERRDGDGFRRGWPGRAEPVGPRRRSGRRRPGRLGTDRPAGASRGARRHAEADQPARPRHQRGRQAARRGPLIPAGR